MQVVDFVMCGTYKKLMPLLLAGATTGLSFAAATSSTVGLTGDSIMARHTVGRRHGINVYSAQDSRRPLMGTHVYFDGAIREVLPDLDDVFDFVTHDTHKSWVTDALEAAELPWVALFHHSVPVSRRQQSEWETAAKMGEKLHRILQTRRFCLGFDTGSEPHFSPDFHYTGHTREQVEGLITKPESSREFGEWMAGLYDDLSPSKDSNGDGITFAADFDFTSDSWDTVGTAMPPDSPFRAFLQTLFKEHLITRVITGMDAAYHGDHSDSVVITSRLLSVPYPGTFGQSLRQLKYPADAVGVTHYVFEHAGTKELAGGITDRFALFDPGIVELASSCIHQQALRNGRRPFYNEFQCGSPDGNTPDNIYRAVFHELQFKPAAINWFAFSMGKDWGWFNVRPILTELAVLRGQLELMSPYLHINRPKRELAIFLPPANPDSAGDPQYAGAEGDQWRILQKFARELIPYGPDVLLSEQLDMVHDYRNLILVAGYMDGATDAFLTKLLSDPPAGSKIMVVCAKTQLFCEPGRRASRDFTHSLMDVLPVSPMGGAAGAVSAQDSGGRMLDMDVAPTVRRNPAVTDGNWIKAGDKTVGWRSDRLTVLAGIPTSGTAALVESFFGLRAPDMRSAGMLHILNRDVTASEPGCYCIAKDQRLTIPPDRVGYDLPRRKPVSGVAGEPGVVRVLDPNELRVIDAGTAEVHVVSESADEIRLQVRMPRLKFPRPVPAELVIVGSRTPTVMLNGASLAVLPVDGKAIYRCALNSDGAYVISR